MLLQGASPDAGALEKPRKPEGHQQGICPRLQIAVHATTRRNVLRSFDLHAGPHQLHVRVEALLSHYVVPLALAVENASFAGVGATRG